MFVLRRTVRFAINAGEVPREVRGPNGYAGVPSFRGFGRHYEMDVACRGPLDPVKGYLINIKDIDAAVRAAAIPVIAKTAGETDAEPAAAMQRFVPAVDGALGGSLASLRWFLTPYYSIEMAKNATSTVLVRQRFEFAASHRLHNPKLSPEENWRLYGKCNHPSGHGHNYVVEPTVRVTLDGQGQSPLTLDQLERTVTALLIDRLDHKHLNIDIPEFGPEGLIPSVENIARVSYQILKPAIEAASPGQVELRDVTVWESEKTASTYPG